MINLKIVFSSRLSQNVLMLAFLSFSGYFLALITLPYQSRILGPELFGMVAFAMAFGIYFQLLIDFGFTISATEKISKHRHDKAQLSRITSTVTLNKLFLLLVGVIVLTLACMNLEPFQEDPVLYFLFAFSYALAALTPDFFYRGTENMKSITLRTISIRALSVILIFLFLNEPSDYYVVPAALAFGNFLALVYAYWNIYTKGVRFVKITRKDFQHSLWQSSLFFYSRVANNIYSASNTFLLGIVYGPTSQIIGHFNSADRITSAAKFTFNPLIDSLYPYMVRSRNYRLLGKLSAYLALPLIATVGFAWLYAYEICGFIFGADFASAGEYFRLLILTSLVAFPSMVLGYPALSPLGLSRFANYSVIIGSFGHIIQLSILLITGSLDVISVCVATIITEFIILTIRLLVLMNYRNLISHELKTEGK